jgi:PAS domain S-box-containing protein
MSIRVLLVEDDPRDAELTQARVGLALPDCRFTVVDDEPAFRRELQICAFDVIIADYNLPSFSGQEALEIARTLCPQVPLILISGSLGEEEAIELLRRGAADFVGKQRLEKLPLVVGRVLEQARERRGRMEAEQARHEAEAYYRLLIDALKDYVVVGLDAQGRIRHCNVAAGSILGCEGDALVGLDARDLFISDNRGAPVPDGLERAERSGSHTDDRWVHSRGGRHFYASVVTTAIRAQDGTLIGYSKIIRDRSEMRRATEAVQRAQREAELDLAQRVAAERALRESAERLSAALDAAGAGTFRWSFAGDALQCDGSLLHLLGVPGARDRHLPLQELLDRIDPADRAAVERACMLCRARGQDLNREFRVQTQAGERWLHARGCTFSEDGSLRYMTGAVVDVTERKLAANALAEASRRKSEFLAILAHELRNPLAPIRSSIDALRLTQNPTVLGNLRETMDRQVRHMVRLIDDLMDISRIDHGQITLERHSFDLRAAIRSALEAVTPLITQRRHRVVTTLPDEPAWVEADETRITQVVSNLLNNAAHYTEPGGLIELRLEREDGEITICVRDNGVGIAPAMQQTIFQSFTRLPAADGTPGGLGIGLAICARLVRMHGGRIEVRSAGSGHGSEFRVSLPLLRAALDAPAPAREPQAVAGLRVLIADDNEDAAESLAIMLRCMGHTALALTQSSAIVPAVSSFAPEVLLMDIGMPGKDGYEVCRELHARLEPEERPLIVAVTGWGEASDRQRSREAGFDLHLTKPVALADLQALFERRQARGRADAALDDLAGRPGGDPGPGATLTRY